MFESLGSSMSPDETLLDVAADWLVRLNEPTATAADFEEWHQWLSADVRHARASQDLEATWKLAFQAAVTYPSKAALKRDEYRVDEPVDAWVGRRRRMRRVRSLVAIAAVLLLAVGIGTWWSLQPVVIQTATAEQRIVRLPDGSRVTVGPRTQVSYRFTRVMRAVTLSNGEVYFEVQRDSDRPFVIGTARGRIEAVGTAFNVDVMPGRLNVMVSEGTVRIEAGGEAASQDVPISSAAVFVSAGRRYVSASNGAEISTLPPAGARASWREGRRAYYDEPLSAVIADLNRYSSDRIELTDPALKDLQYTGTVFPEDLGDWLMSLPGAFPVQVQRRGHTWSIERSHAAKSSGVTTP